MRQRGIVGTALALTLALTACGSSDDPQTTASGPTPPAAEHLTPDVGDQGATIAVWPQAGGFDRPTGLVQEPGPRGRILVLERPGTARWMDGSAPAAGDPFLDLTTTTASEDENGLLGLVFVDRGRQVVVHRNDADGDTEVTLFPVRDGRAQTDRGRVLLTAEQPYANHNGGQMAVGPDGRVYLGLGDGGSAYDPRRNGQKPDTVLSKLLRWDPRRPGAPWEPIGTGLRNPWRLTFDTDTGALWIADAGRDVDRTGVEEINRLSAGEIRPGAQIANFGWSALEGHRRLPGRELDPTGRLVAPVVAYGAESGCSVIGGVVPRDSRLADLSSRYLFGDACSGRVWSVPTRGPIREMRREPILVPNQSAWLQARDGRVLVADEHGLVSRLVPGRPRR